MPFTGTATVNFGTGLNVPKDAVCGWWFPETASQWSDLLAGTGLYDPTAINLCQDISGAMADVMGLLPATNIGTAATYRSPVTGFSRVGIKSTLDRSLTSFVIPASLLGTTVNSFLLLQVWAPNTIPTGVTWTMLNNTAGTLQGGATLTNGVVGPILRMGNPTYLAQGVTEQPASFILATQHDFQHGVTVLQSSNGERLVPTYVRNTGPQIALLGDPTGSNATSDATLLYSTLFTGRAAELSQSQISTIMSRMQSGPPGPNPGSQIATVTVTGQTGILSTSNVEAWMMGDTTSAHNSYEHSMIPLTIRCGNIVNGVGFDIVVSSDWKLTGTFTLRWVWS